jgi:hypothetical protein
VDLDVNNPLFQLSEETPEMVFGHFERDDEGTWMACYMNVLTEIKERPIGSNQPVLPSYN